MEKSCMDDSFVDPLCILLTLSLFFLSLSLSRPRKRPSKMIPLGLLTENRRSSTGMALQVLLAPFSLAFRSSSWLKSNRVPFRHARIPITSCTGLITLDIFFKISRILTERSTKPSEWVLRIINSFNRIFRYLFIFGYSRDESILQLQFERISRGDQSKSYLARFHARILNI